MEEEEVPTLTIDSRSILEVADEKHRYGKNLRLYFQEFNKLHPIALQVTSSFQQRVETYKPFFHWLDDPNTRPSDLEECTLQCLDQDTVLYLETESEREPYKYQINENGILEQVVSKIPLSTHPRGDMFVIKNGSFYVSEKKTKTLPRFHHSSFFGGSSVNAAGIIVCESGSIKVVYPHSGHYRPLDQHLLWLLTFLQKRSIDLSSLLVDAQRVFKVSRHNDKETGSKSKKMDCAYLLRGDFVHDFLRVKFRIFHLGLLDQIRHYKRINLRDTRIPDERTKSVDPTSVFDASAEQHRHEHLTESQFSSQTLKPEDKRNEPCSTSPTSFPLLVSNSFSRATSTASLNLLASSPVLN